MKQVNFQLINKLTYQQIVVFMADSVFGNLLLPNTYMNQQWGVVAVDNNLVVGGWIGTLRGNGKYTRFLTRSVYFDSYPILKEGYERELLALVQYVQQQAHKDGIIQLNLTHWVRGENKLNVPLTSKCATFLIDLSKSIDELWKDVDSKQRNIIRKGEKNEVEVLVLQGERAVNYLHDFQTLRQVTQSRAIGKNAKASMLLKSNDYFRNILLQPSATLFVGKYDSEVASVALMLQGGQTVYYYSGGSNRDVNRKTGCSAYVIWKAIEYFKNRGDITYFDMGGVPVNPTKEHPAYGVYEFKRSFGGTYMEFDNGAIVINKWKYALLSFVLKNRKLLRVLSKGGN